MTNVPASTIPPTLANVSYGPHARHVLDLWRPESAGASRLTPLLLFIHGGGFRHGDKQNIPQTLLGGCLDAGISVASMNYRLVPEVIYPAPMLDGARALQFIRSRAKEWRIDPQRIAASGGSAGGGISLWLGFHEDLANPESDDSVARQSTRLTCVAVRNAQTSYDPRFIKQLIAGEAHRSPGLLGLFGLTPEIGGLSAPPETTRLFEDASPINHVRPGAPPVFLTYNQPNEDPPPDLPAGPGIHHPRFGVFLKERLDELGVECTVRCAGDPDGLPTELHFLQKHLRPEA